MSEDYEFWRGVIRIALFGVIPIAIWLWRKHVNSQPRNPLTGHVHYCLCDSCRGVDE
jgi:hypothetical protein